MSSEQVCNSYIMQVGVGHQALIPSIRMTEKGGRDCSLVQPELGLVGLHLGTMAMPPDSSLAPVACAARRARLDHHPGQQPEQ